MAARRAPAAGTRQRDAERSKASILDAALVEFGDHGFAGARTVAIARRAGVNPQLISYYFDGKAGLYRALQQRWQQHSGPLAGAELPLEQVVANFVRASIENRSWARLLIWEGLAYGNDPAPGSASEPFSSMVDDVRSRQHRGEIGPDLDPAVVLILLFSAALAPVALPQLVEQSTGTATHRREFVEHYTEQLAAVVRRLR